MGFRDRLWKYRGHRILPHMKNGVRNAVVSIFLIGFLTPMYWMNIGNLETMINWIDIREYQLFINYSEWNWSSILKSVSISIVVGLISIVVAYFLLHDFYKAIWHRQKIARMFYSNRFVEEQRIQSESQWSEKQVSKNKITYFPRAYYKKKKGHIYIRISMDMSRFQDRYLNLGKDLESGLFCDLVDREVEENFVVFKLLYDASKKRIPIREVTVQNGSMKLMDGVYWSFDKLPHMLIAGGTGGGKTYFILTIIQSVLKSNAKIKILDPKNADLADLEAVLPKGTVFSKSTGILMTLRKSVDDMMKRSEDMKNMPDYRTGENYAYLGLPPVFIFFDEYVAFMDLLDMKERNEAMGYMKQLVMLGRQMGYFLVLGAQRPDAKYLADGIRDQFNFRVTLGRMSETGYGMMFGDSDKTFINKSVKGRGYADSGTSTIMEFYSPFVPKGYDFMKEIEQASVGEVGASATAVASGNVATASETSVGNERSK
ncbi:FtsK/SpoIIIE domain-containing protein [Alkalihalobacillus sp. NPDC078783]